MSKKIKITNKFRNISEIYKKFSKIKRIDNAPKELIIIWDEYDSHRDYSDEALEEAFRKESLGEDFNIIRSNAKINGYIEGKQWMDLTLTEYWIPDILSGELPIGSLYNEDLPDSFLDKVLKNVK